MSDPISNVNPLQGTASDKEFSTGNTLPIAARPFGMHHWSLQTAKPNWFFHPSHRQLWGMRLTHQPSPWMGDYGSLLVTAFSGSASKEIAHQASAYRWKTCQPNVFRVELLRYGILCEMAPTERGCVFAFTTEGAEALKIRLSLEGVHALEAGGAKNSFAGVSRNTSGGTPEDFGLHFYGEFSAAFESQTTLADGGYWTFPQGVRRVELRLAGSFIDQSTARAIHARELAHASLDAVAAEGAEIWNGLLNRIQIEPKDETQARTFYSCLYRCLLFPRLLEEGDGRHYSPYDGLVHSGPLCTDNGFWDTHRTVYPLLGVFYPDKLRVILEGWLNACRQAQWSPKWASPGPRNCMIGTHFNAVVADAVARGVTDWNVEEAFTYLWKDATELSNDGCFGREGLEHYLKLGYVPVDKQPYSVSATMDYAYDDFCIAQVARFLGRTKEADILQPRTQNYRNVFDPAVGFARERKADGTWASFREFGWGGGYIEGGPWQHTFNVPHDPEGLAELLRGGPALCRKLDAMLAKPPTFDAAHYGFEIHEMTEMALAGFGQYAQSNQPVHGFLFLYALLGETEKTSHWVGQVARELYSPDLFPGDEDNGEMAAWYVWATLGRYPQCPGKNELVRFQPLAAAVLYSPTGEEIKL